MPEEVSQGRSASRVHGTSPGGRKARVWGGNTCPQVPSCFHLALQWGLRVWDPRERLDGLFLCRRVWTGTQESDARMTVTASKRDCTSGKPFHSNPSCFALVPVRILKPNYFSQSPQLEITTCDLFFFVMSKTGKKYILDFSDTA